MASGIIRICRLFSNSIKINNIKGFGLLKTNTPLVQSARESANFFNKKPASLLWKSVTSVSNAGRRRGRAKGLPRVTDLNKGQVRGVGKTRMIFPGLNAPLYSGGVMIERERLPPDPDRENKLITLQNQYVGKKKRMRIHPLERGWTSASLGGKMIGPPDPIDGEHFEGFQSCIVLYKNTSTMTSKLGRARRCQATVVTGNGKGLAGFSSAMGIDAKTVITRAKNKAGQRLYYYERYNDHTVLHDFFTQFHKTKIFVSQKPKGYGIKAHRIIKSICQVLGITDIYAKIEGSLNPQYIIKSFFIGLFKQKTYQQLADEKQLHVVELRKESGYFPKIVASPETVRTESDLKKNEILNFKEYLHDGKLVLRKKPIPAFYTKLPSYQIHLRKMERIRDHDNVRIRLKAEYGSICSFHVNKYPEAKIVGWKKQREQPADET